MTDRLRVAILGSSNFPISEPFAGGMEAHISQLAQSLSARGHEVSLFAAPGSSEGHQHSQLSVRTLELSPISRADATTPAWMVHEHHAYLSVMLELAGSLRDSFDVVHNHSLHYLPIAMSRTLATPMLTTLHTPPFAWLESAVDISATDADTLVAVSAHAAHQWAPVVDDIGVVFNGIDLRRWPAGPGGDSAVWTGRIVPEKAPHLAIAAARAAGFDLDLAGPISNRAYFEDFIEPMLDDHVRYVGHLRQGELAALVGAAAVALVTPVWEEPYGLVVAEALAAGTPVAAFRRGGIPEIVDETCGVLAPADDVPALAAAAIAASRLSRADARARAESTCSHERMVDEYLALYRKMIAQRQRRLHPEAVPTTA